MAHRKVRTLVWLVKHVTDVDFLSCRIRFFLVLLCRIRFRLFIFVVFVFVSFSSSSSSSLSSSSTSSSSCSSISPENATNFKEQGNEAFKAKKYQDAWIFYTKGLDLKCTDPILNAQLLCNRAAVSLAVQNYGYALRDAAKCLSLDAQNMKAYWRAAKAALQLSKPEEATAFARRGLEKAPESAELAALLDQADQLTARLHAENAKRERSLAEGQRLIEAFNRRGVVHQADAEKLALLELGPGIFGSTPPRAKLSGRNGLKLPLVLLYPTVGQFDLVEAADESSCLLDHLAQMFSSPAPWDPKRLYVQPAQFVAYIRAVDEEGESPSVLYRVNLRTHLNMLLGSVIKACELGILTFYILPSLTHSREFESKFSTFAIKTI